MEKIWNTTSVYTKPSIDKAINKLVENRSSTQATSILLLDMMRTDPSLQQEQVFYATILEALMNGDRVDYPEKEQFLILHTSLIKVYKELNVLPNH